MEKIRKPRVLLTGFTPFGGETVNPALEAVKRVRCPEAELRILEVPTVFGDSARLVTAEMDASGRMWCCAWARRRAAAP